MGMLIKYPVRCRIVDPGGTELSEGFKRVAPLESVPHVGKEGLAERVGAAVRIKLDDGNILWGHQCWWVPLDPVD